MSILPLRCPSPKCGKILEVTGEKIISLNGHKTLLKMFKCGHFKAERILDLSWLEASLKTAADENSIPEYYNETNYQSLTKEEALTLKAQAELTYERDTMWEKAFPYQREGVKIAEASNYQCVIADEMGLGKTVQALLGLRYNLAALTPALIVVPSSLTFNWAKEIRAWLTDDQFPLMDSEGKPNLDNAKWLPYIHTDGKNPLWPGMQIYIVSQDMIWKDAVLESIQNIPFQLFIGDEIHKFANVNAKRTTGLLQAIHHIPHRIVLSGTPIKNKFAEYFIPLHIVKPDHWPTFRVMGDYAQFYGSRMLGLAPWKEKAFFEKTASYVIRRKKADVLKDLPELRRDFQIVDVADDKQFVKGYNSMIDDLEETIEAQKAKKASSIEILGIMQKMRHLVGLMKIKHALAFLTEFFENTTEDEVLGYEEPTEDVRRWLAKTLELAKAPGSQAEGEAARHRAIEICKKYGLSCEYHKSATRSTGEKITIGVHHQDVAKYFTQFAEQLGYEPLLMTGKDSAIEKQAIEDKFRSIENPILTATILACGEGRNLQFCQNALLVEREWNPANEEQFELRFNRPLKCAADGSLLRKVADGEYQCQTCKATHYQSHVRITYLIAKDTIDEFFHELVEMKRAVKGQVLDKGWSLENDPRMIMDLAMKVTMKRMKYTGR